MIGGMRSFARSPLALALFGVLVVGLILTMGDPLTNLGGGDFVKVGEREFRPLQIENRVQDQLERYRQQSGQVISPREAAQRGLHRQIYAQLLDRTTVLAYADKLGVKASPTAVSNTLIKAGLKDALGRLDLARMAQIASEQGMTRAQFEQEVRDDITLQYIQQAAFSGFKAPEVLLKPLLAFYGEQRTVSIAQLTAAAVPEPKAPTPEELKTWYDKNNTGFREPERRRISVLSYMKEDFYGKVNITPEQVKAEYDRRIAEFSGPETREIAQFSSMDRNKVQAFVDTVKQGKTLEQAQAANPGVERVDMSIKPGDITDKQYNEDVFKLPANQIAGPAKVGQAFMAVQVKTIIPGTPRPFTEVSEEILTSLKQAEATRLFNQSEEAFYDMAGGTPLEDVSKNIGAPLITFAPIDSQGLTSSRQRLALVSAHPKEFEALFKLAGGQTTDVIETELPDPATGEPQPVRMIFRLDEVVAPRTPPLAEVETQARNEWLRQKRVEAAEKVANDVVAAVKAGEPLVRAATARKMQATPGVLLDRLQQSTVSQAIQNAAYTLKLNDVSVIKDEQGVPFVVKVDKIEPVAPEQAAMVRAQLGQQIEQSVQSDIGQVFINGVRAEVKPHVNDRAVQAYFDALVKDEAQ
jgi:peptidyl-prolyl cis-trans isomerase D